MGGQCGTQMNGAIYFLEDTKFEMTMMKAAINPFQSNFSATRILPSSYLFCAGKRLVGYL
jgi:hypothetical protein